MITRNTEASTLPKKRHDENGKKPNAERMTKIANRNNSTSQKQEEASEQRNCKTKTQ